MIFNYTKGNKMKFNYDDKVTCIIGKINTVLSEHGLIIELDDLVLDGYMVAELKSLETKAEVKPVPVFEILTARYHSKGIIRDVKEKVIEHVKNGVLNLAVDNNELGVDPLYGAPKTLSIVYKYNDEIKVIEVAEGQTVVLP
jgi:hypothetical protein